MSIKKKLADEMEITRQNFHHLLDSIPKVFFLHPGHNPARKYCRGTFYKNCKENKTGT